MTLTKLREHLGVLQLSQGQFSRPSNQSSNFKLVILVGDGRDSTMVSNVELIVRSDVRFHEILLLDGKILDGETFLSDFLCRGGGKGSR